MVQTHQTGELQGCIRFTPYSIPVPVFFFSVPVEFCCSSCEDDCLLIVMEVEGLILKILKASFLLQGCLRTSKTEFGVCATLYSDNWVV